MSRSWPSDPPPRALSGAGLELVADGAAAGPLDVPEGARYDAGGTLGRGGMGEVRSAWDARLGRDVALKTAHRGDADAEARLVREAQLTAGLEHPGIVPIYDAGRTPDGRPCYAMRLIRGRALSVVLSEAPDLEARLRTVRHFLDACEAVAYAHGAGVLHRDLTPRNLMLGDYGETLVVDWGLACEMDAGGRGPPEVVGTPGYTAPEVERGEPADTRADVWSLGAVLHSVLTGAPPGAPGGPLDAAPPELVAICRKATAARPADRYRDARALAADLEAWFEGRRVGAYHTTPWRLARRLLWAWRAPLAVGLVATAALGFALFDGWQRTADERNRAVAAEAEAVAARGAADISLAASLAAQARTAEAAGDRMRAEVLAAEALLRVPDDPEARGVLVRFAGHPRPRRVAWTPLPGCQAVALSPDGHALACAGADGVQLLDLSTGGARALNGAASRLAFAGHGGTLIGVRGSELLRWRGGPDPEVLAGGLALTALDGDGPAGAAVAIGRGHVFTVGDAGRVEEIGSACGQRGHSVQASHPDGTLAAVCAGGWRVLVSDAAGDRILPVPSNAGAAMSVAVSTPDAARVAVGTVDGVVRVHDRRTGALLVERRVSSGAATRLALHGERLAVGSAAGFVTVLPLDGRAPVRLPGEAAALRWIRDGTHLRVAGPDGLSEWALPASGAPAVHRYASGLAAVDLSPDGESLLTAHGDGSVVLRRRADGVERLRRRLHESVAKSAAFSPDGTRLAIGHAVRFELPVLAAPGWTQAGALGHEKVRRVAWLADGLLLVAPYARGLRAWRGGIPVGLGPTEQVVDLAASADRQTGAVLDDHGGLWHIDPRQLPAAVPVGIEPGASSVAAHADGLIVAREGAATWIGRDGTPLGTVALSGGPVLDVAVDAAGTRLATAHLDGAVRLWSLPDGAPLAVLRGHTARTVSLRFTPAGDTLLSGSWDGTARVWPLAPLSAEPRALRDAVNAAWGVGLDEIIRRPAGP